MSRKQTINRRKKYKRRKTRRNTPLSLNIGKFKAKIFSPICKKYGMVTAKGNRKYMEDRWITHNNLYGVFDGHSGKDAAEYISKNLVSVLRNKLPLTMKIENQIKKAPNALKQSFVKIDTDYKKLARGGKMSGATTAVAVLLFERKYVIANIGDSRCMLINRNGRLRQLTKDHTLCDPNERSAIITRSLYYNPPHVCVENWGDEYEDDWRVTNSHKTIGLSCARSIGYYTDDNNNVITELNNAVTPDYLKANPNNIRSGSMVDIKVVNRSTTDAWLVLASDGLWDGADFEKDDISRVIKMEERKGGTAKTIAKELVRMAFKKKSNDNITVLVIDLR